MNVEELLSEASGLILERMEGAVGQYEELHLREARLAIATAWAQIEYADLAKSEGR